MVSSAPPGVQQAIGEDMAPIQILGQLDLVDSQKIDIDIERHGLDRAHIIARLGGYDLFFPGDQGNALRAAESDNAIINLACQKP